LRDLTWRTVTFIGFAQALALIPGTSRSGITMTAALLCDLNRESAARFSFLLAVPIIVATGLLKSIELVNSPQGSIQLLSLTYAITLSAVVAWTCIHFFLQLITRIGFLPFVIYRVILGSLLLLVYFS
jgi:undecaprenyl-diphosphatase